MVLKKRKKELENLGYVLPKGLLPMSVVVEKLHIDINYLEKMLELQNKNIKE